MTLAHRDLSGTELDDLRLDRCLLRAVILTGSTATALVARDVRFAGCELSGARWPHAELHRVGVEHGRGMGLVLADVTGRHVRFTECRLDGANFRDAALEACVFERCGLVEADFSGARLEAVAFVGCDLTRAEFHNVRCEHVFFDRCTVEGVRGVAHLRGAVVTDDAVVPLALSAFAALGIAVDDDAPRV